MNNFQPKDFIILVVDDVQENLQLLISMLNKKGYRISFANSGKQALERIKNIKPDLILLDLMMPELNGIEVCKRLKANQETREIPIIFITANHEQNKLLQAFEVGAVDYIKKPIKEAEILARVKNHLELKKTKDELKLARETAEEATRLKSQFIANISHEIRTPMNAILGMTEMLLNMQLTPEQLDCVETINSGGEHLLNMLNNLLDFSKLEAQEMQLENTNFDLLETMEQLVKLFLPISKDLEINLITDSSLPRYVRGDVFRLRQILINLLSNALKFTDFGSVIITLVAKTITADKLTIKFTVTDTGIGIYPEALNNLFQSFYQVDASTTRKYGGTGLGLSICKELVHLMGGDIGVESVPGEGSNFWFTVTFEQVSVNEINQVITAQNQKREEVKTINQLNNLKVLLVEDTPLNQKVILHQLSVIGCEADCVNNGQEALETLAIKKYDLILIDCNMPLLDGYQTTKILKNNSENIIVIGMSAGDLTAQKKCFAAQMDDYLNKPVSLHKLYNMLLKWSSKVGENKQQNVQSLIDRNHLYRLTSGDETFQQEILEDFVRGAKVYLSQAKIAVENNDAIALYNKIHQIKGIAGNAGITSIYELSVSLENQASENNLQGANEKLTELEQLLEKVEDELFTDF